MARAKFDETRDQRLANEVIEDRRMMCAAHGCPLRWSIQTEGRKALCTWHSRANPRDWPQVTQELLDAEAERARRAQEPAQHPAAPMTKEDKIAVLERMRETLVAKGAQ